VGERPGGQTVVMAPSPEPNLLVRVLWFLFVGWWLSFWAVLLAILFQLTILGIPVAVWIINRIPQITTLKSSRRLQIVQTEAGVVVVSHADRAQRPWWQRAIWYVLVGWWAVSMWMLLAWVASVTLLLMPLGFWMYGQTGKIQTLRR